MLLFTNCPVCKSSGPLVDLSAKCPVNGSTAPSDVAMVGCWLCPPQPTLNRLCVKSHCVCLR